ncbi:hypothetical protein FEM08_01620 [Flavobacterium gilvum]|nr:hypothetical protein FEM08_01620 [Flavobacterium gilvum]
MFLSLGFISNGDIVVKAIAHIARIDFKFTLWKTYRIY